VLATLYWTALGLAGALILAVVVLLASVLGPRFPTEDDLPTLPESYSYGDPSPGCGSGGCFVTVVATPDDGVVPDTSQLTGQARDDCRAHGWLDRRKQCTSVTVHPGGDITVSVMIHDLGK
jgi:hypothetical protein